MSRPQPLQPFGPVLAKQNTDFLSVKEVLKDPRLERQLWPMQGSTLFVALPA